MTLDSSWPTWLRDVDSLLAVHPHFVLSGDVRDWYRLPLSDTPLAPNAARAIYAALSRADFDVVLVHDVVDGYSVLTGSEEEAVGWAAIQSVMDRDLRSAEAKDLGVLGDVIRSVAMNDSRRIALVLNDASRLVNRLEDLQAPELELFRIASKVSRQARIVTTEASDRHIYNPVFWLVDREYDLPAWFTAGNSGVRGIAVPFPDLAERQAISDVFLRRIEDEERRYAVAGELASGTDGLAATALVNLVSLFSDQGIDYDDAAEAIRTFKVGATESPWTKGQVSGRLRGDPATSRPDATTMLSSRVLGQPQAVTKSVDILTRAVMGLSGAQATQTTSRPRGVLFFVGPTGVGKTELAKAITELVFGTAEAYARFDMSEFAAEHAGDRLIGAPPGYVGFDSGGELTNAVRSRPYSLLLFDEIEKAHPLILDKFLQILEDGRLTDGRGTTVHFSETLIVFTSNIGTYRLEDDGRSRIPNIEPSDSFEEIEARVRREVTKYFSEQLNRPELLNRIGENVVVFDFIRPEVAQEIVDLQISNVVRRVNDATGAAISLTEAAAASIQKLATANLWFGGRGIGNVVESRFVNPLARALFAADISEGQSISVVSVHEDAFGPVVELG